MANPGGITCETCRFWEHYDEGMDLIGHCRRRAPTLEDKQPSNFQSDSGTPEPDGTFTQRIIMARWPVTRHDDWCGEWEEAAPGVST